MKLLFTLLANLITSFFQKNQPDPVEDETSTGDLENPMPTPFIQKVTVDIVKQVFTFTPRKNIEDNLHLILDALKKKNLDDKDMLCYVLATIFVENDKFKATAEQPSKWSTKSKKPPYDFSNYIGKGGNRIGTNDHEKYRGSGFLQLTLFQNYEYYDKKLGLDGGLLEQGYVAGCVPEIAAAILAEYIKDREDKIRYFLKKRDFKEARKLVNGPAALHWEKFKEAYIKFENLLS